jgi:peptide/nickel transport system substrate-binding protein
VVSVLHSLGYKATYRIATDPYTREDRLGLQAGFYAWSASYPSPASFIGDGLSCASFDQGQANNENTAEFCDPTIDRELAHATALEANGAQAASQLWARIDRQLTDQAPWVPFANGVVLELKSTRVGNYQYNEQWGTLLDQLWVR